MMPEGWRHARLAEVVRSIVDTCAPSPNDDRPYVALEHIAQGEPRLLGWERAAMAASTKAEFRAGDLLFGKLRPNLRKAVLAPFDGVCSTDILVLRAAQNLLDPVYLEHLAHWPPLQDHAVRTASGTKMPRTSWSLLSAFVLPLPPLGEQRKIAAILSAVDDAIEVTQAVIDQLQVVKEDMMAELLTRGLPGRHMRFKQTEIGYVPEMWEVAPLGALVAEGPDNGLYKPQSDYGDGVPIVRIDAFDNGDVVDCGDLRRVRASRDEVARYGLRPNDILVNRVNSLSHIAKSAIVGLLSEPTVFESNMMRFAVDSQRLYPAFAFRVISAPTAKTYFVGRAKQAVAQASVNQGDVRALPIPVPSLAEQAEISNIADALDLRLATENHFRNGLAETKSALMSVLLTGEVRVTPDEVAA